ncbi:MAG TPA: ribosomal protein S18-alanine N-acetyltransferase [Anaerolineaceae bacterium]|nr:ribosomal protein S18-alanine N-acetyltransferase [Anaerolineaceae bacterium]
MEEQGVRVRPMRMEDVEEVFRVDQLSFSLPWTERSYRFELTQNPNSMLWVADALGADGAYRVVGMVVIWLIVDEIHIGTIAVHPDYRHQGIGRRLLAEALLAGSERGAAQATLEVRRSNLNAQALYRQFGFTTAGMRPRYYRDNGEDALILTLERLDRREILKMMEQNSHQAR